MTRAELARQLAEAAARPGRASSDYDLNRDRPASGALRRAGVLIAIEEREGSARLWLTKRASSLKHHPGQIALAGGKVDPGDDGPVAAALREAEEEIGLARNRVEVVGTLPVHETVTRFEVTPVIGLIEGRLDPVAEAGEVEEVFDVPLGHVLDPARYHVRSREWAGRVRHYHVVPYGPYYIWGATARMLLALAERMTP